MDLNTSMRFEKYVYSFVCDMPFQFLHLNNYSELEIVLPPGSRVEILETHMVDGHFMYSCKLLPYVAETIKEFITMVHEKQTCKQNTRVLNKEKSETINHAKKNRTIDTISNYFEHSRLAVKCRLSSIYFRWLFKIYCTPCSKTILIVSTSSSATWWFCGCVGLSTITFIVIGNYLL